MDDARPPLLLVISGPSGVGKDALVERILELRPEFKRPVTMTTRAPRETETDGVHYVFVSPEEFRANLEAGELLEHAEVYGSGSYGLPRAQLRRALEAGDAIVRVDIQGVEALRGLLPGALFVMLVPGSIDDLERHLRERGGAHAEADLRSRLEAAEREMARSDLFHHVVQNVEGDLDGTVARVLAIADEERARPDRPPLGV